MKKGTLRLLPLQADLCLNKQKVDIENFKGWNKCNAPVYGNCLSPLYKNNGTHHDIFKGNDYYDWAGGALSKNGTVVLSGAGSKKIKKTKTNFDYRSMAVSEDGLITYAKETSGTSVAYSLHGGTEQNVNIANCNRIVDIKAFANQNTSLYGIAVLYLHTGGNYGYYLVWNDGENSYSGYGANSGTTTWSGFNVISPLIQVGVMGDHKFLVSFFGASGNGISGTEVRNVYVQSGTIYDNPGFSDSTLYPTRYATEDNAVGVEIYVNQKYQDSASAHLHEGDTSKYDVEACIGVSQEIEIYVTPHKYAARVKMTDAMGNTETFVFPASDTRQYYGRTIGYRQKLYDNEVPNGTKAECIWTGSAYYSGWLNINNSVTATLSGTGLCAKDSGDTICQSSNYTVRPYFYTDPAGFGGFTDFEVESVKNINDPDDSGAEKVWLSVRLSKSNTPYGLQLTSYAGSQGESYHAASDSEWWQGKLINGITTGSAYVTYGWGCTSGGGGLLTGYKGDNYFATGRGEYYSIYSYPSWLDFPSGYSPNTGKDGKFIQKSGNSYYNQRYSWSGADTVYIGYKSKSEYTESSLKEVDCCMDDGRLYCVGALTDNYSEPLPTKCFGLAGTFGSYDPSTNKISYTSISSFNIAYDEDDNTNVFPKYYAGMNISIQNHYLRIVYLFKAKASDSDFINILVDSLEIGENADNATILLPGVQTGTNDNIQGGVKNTTPTSGWRLLFNNNLLSNIACYEDKNYIGTILADWFTADGEFCVAYNTSVLYYKDNNNTIWKLELVTTGADWEYKYIEDRYIVLNTVNYFNCYDTQTGQKRHWASDYNNRIMYGVAFTNYSNNDYFAGLLTATRFSGLIITGQNANYEVTKDTITGIELGAIRYTNCLKDNMAFISCGTPYGAFEGIDLYRGDGGSTSAIYICSYSNKMKYINNDLINPYAVYPIADGGNVRYNPNLFTQFIKSYNNKDMVIADGISYKLIYYNNVIPVMAYNLLDGVEELVNAFVLQTSYYGVSETRLYQMNYSNGVGVEVVADITNLEYLGALPTQALFWSAQNRAIYTFKGNCIMTLSQYANELTAIFGKWYNPATQELFLDTNIGILVFSDLGTYCLEWAEETETRSIVDIFFYPDRFLINLIDDTEYTYYYSYNLLEGYESNKIKIVTKYYGNGLTPITVNNVYVRLYNQGVTNAEGDIIFKGHTITDIGVHTDTKTVSIGGVDDPTANPPTVAGEQWDSETDTMLVKYTPQYNRGLGFSLELETTFPIIDIKFDYVEEGQIESQIAHINI